MAKYPSVYMTADIVVFRTSTSGSEVLLIQRKNEPFKGAWALPGGFFDQADQNVLAAAIRELQEETSLKLQPKDLKLVGVFSEKGRDPREFNAEDPCRILSTAFFASLDSLAPEPKAADDAKAVRYFAIEQIPKMAFDHKQIIEQAAALYRAK